MIDYDDIFEELGLYDLKVPEVNGVADAVDQEGDDFKPFYKTGFGLQEGDYDVLIYFQTEFYMDDIPANKQDEAFEYVVDRSYNQIWRKFQGADKRRLASNLGNDIKMIQPIAPDRPKMTGEHIPRNMNDAFYVYYQCKASFFVQWQ